MSERPTWQHIHEAPRCVLHRPNLVRTGATALIVGTILFLLNHLLSVLRGHADTATWVETGVSFVVPFCVANLGLLIATRRPAGSDLLTAPGADVAVPGAPTWRRLAECPRCILHPPHLTRTLSTAFVVGTIYFAINQLGPIAGGHGSVSDWTAGGLTYLVPFSVSNIGVLLGSRRQEAEVHAVS